MMNRLLTLRETADLLSVSPSTVRRHVRNLGFPCHRIGGRLKFKEKDVEEWIENHKIKNQMEARIYNRNLQNLLTKSSEPIIEEEKGDKMARSSRSRRNYGYGSVYVRMTSEEVPRYYIDYRTREGKRVQRLIKEASSWEMAENALKTAVFNEFYEEHSPKKKKIGFRDFAEIYLEDFAKTSKESWETDMYRLRALKEFFGDAELRSITPLMIEKFRAWRLKRGNSRSTCNRFTATLKRLYTIAIQENYAEENPVKKVKFFKELEYDWRIVSEEEEEKLLSVCTEHLRPILVVMLHCGLRKNECLKLRWSNVMFVRREIRVEGKGQKVRFVPLNDRVLKELKVQKSKTAQYPYAFMNPYTGRPYNDIRESFTTAYTHAGIGHLRPHDLRHTFASRLVSNGVSLQVVKELLGHSTLSVTQRYLHGSKEDQRKAVDTLVQKTGKNAPSCYTTVTQREEGELKKLLNHLISAN